MEPDIKKDALVFVQKTDIKKIKPGDIVSYISDGAGTNNCHRVGELQENGFMTFCNVSEVPDSIFVDSSNFSGKVVFVFNPIAGIIAKTKTPGDLLKFIVLPVAAVFLLLIIVGILCIKAPKKDEF